MKYVLIVTSLMLTLTGLAKASTCESAVENQIINYEDCYFYPMGNAHMMCLSENEDNSICVDELDRASASCFDSREEEQVDGQTILEHQPQTKRCARALKAVSNCIAAQVLSCVTENSSDHHEDEEHLSAEVVESSRSYSPSEQWLNNFGLPNLPASTGPQFAQ